MPVSIKFNKFDDIDNKIISLKNTEKNPRKNLKIYVLLMCQNSLSRVQKCDRRKYISLNSISYFLPGHDTITYRDCHGIK